MRVTAGNATAPLADILGPKLEVLIVAINPPPTAAALGLHFATPTNGFWRLLHQSGLTPRLFAPAEALRLLDVKLGLVSLVARPTRLASELSAAERREGAEGLREVVRRYRPRIVAPLGVTLIPALLPEEPNPGPGLRVCPFERTTVFVLPNLSGRNRAYPGIVGKLPWYRALADLVGASQFSRNG